MYDVVPVVVGYLTLHVTKNTEIIAAASAAFKWSYAHGLKITALSSLGFAGVGLICCLLCENIDAKMNDKTEIYLENDIYAEKNKYH